MLKGCISNAPPCNFQKKKKKLHNEVPFFSENTAVDDA